MSNADKAPEIDDVDKEKDGDTTQSNTVALTRLILAPDFVSLLIKFTHHIHKIFSR